MKQFSNILYIDTRDNKQIIVHLKTNSGMFEEKSIANKNKAQAALPLIERVLKRAKIKTSDIDEIKVERGPGSFTGLRVGISIANTLAFSSQVRINGKKLGEIELPEY